MDFIYTAIILPQYQSIQQDDLEDKDTTKDKNLWMVSSWRGDPHQR
jgi:hypothetical protein